MFDIGKSYQFTSKDVIEKDTEVYTHGEVIEVALPLVKFRNEEGREIIINTASSNFLRAEPLS